MERAINTYCLEHQDEQEVHSLIEAPIPLSTDTLTVNGRVMPLAGNTVDYYVSLYVKYAVCFMPLNLFSHAAVYDRRPSGTATYKCYSACNTKSIAL